jgi:hypothetical protein
VFLLKVNEAMQPIAVVRPPGALVSIRGVVRDGVGKDKAPVYKRNNAYE